MKHARIFLTNFILVLFVSMLFTMNSCEKKEPDPFACFQVSSTLIDIGEIINTSNCSNDAFSYLWDDDNGNSSVLPEPSFSYNEPGNYIITLTAYSQSGNKQNTAKETITVEVMYGDVTFWCSEGSYDVIVKVGQLSDIITLNYSSDPGCNATGCANFKLPTGTYSFTAEENTSWFPSNWSGLFAIKANQCNTQKLTYN
ncbi:unnamed protein product [marine sediment metagenome]|uniref:PKD domain-containing protein n=1 Tax=marine sediment metagenome TaxID=412755 RepID=X1R7F2_9ZZZZ